jgi:branched-chain amino acid transport system permease protein
MLTLATVLSAHAHALAQLAQFDWAIFFQQIEIGITLGAMYALVALGYTMVYGIIELINFAHGDIFMWATVIIFVALGILHIGSTPGNIFALIGLMLLLLVIGMAVSGSLNFTLERLVYRRLRKAPRLAPLIAAVGASFILETVAQVWRGSGQVAFPTIFPANVWCIGGVSTPTTCPGGLSIPWLDVFVVLMAVALMVGLDRFIRLTKVGRAMRATAQDPEAASLMGVNVNRTISLTFAIGGALAGAAALFYNLEIGNVWYLTGFQLGLIAFTAAVLGGIGNIYGAVLGGFLIGLISTLATQYVPNGTSWSLAIVFAILVLILTVRPSGLLGQQVPDKV